MPLVRGAKAKTQSGVSRNIRAEIHSGKKRSQAIAIAMRLAGKPKPRRRRKGRR